jgi:hypothetical protein
VDALCDHPYQWDLLADHSELAMKAVEELPPDAQPAPRRPRAEEADGRNRRPG